MILREPPQGRRERVLGRWWPSSLLLGALCLAACADEGSDDDSELTGPDANADYCEPVADWDAELEAWEFEVLEIVNQRRSEGADCRTAGSFGPTGALTMQTQLRCAARAHSLDMAERGFFDHTNPDGDGPGERIAATGYQPATWGENIAGGYPDPEAVMEGWMGSDGHCANLMSPDFEHIGVGAYSDGSPLWTQVFGSPAS